MKDIITRFTNVSKGYAQIKDENALSSPSSDMEASRPSAAFCSRQLRDSFETLTRFVCVLMFLIGTVMFFAAVQQEKSDKACTAQLSMWSPVMDAVEYEERDWTSIFSTHSDFVGIPDREMEERWHGIVDMPAVLIPPERISSLNRSIEQGFVEADPPAQRGYIAGVEVFHHLHCLNMIRQYAMRDRYPEGLVPTILKYNSPAVAVAHVDHCIETLREALTCNADLTPYLWYKHPVGKGSGPAKEDFQATHKCKRFDRIVQWVKMNGVDVPVAAVKGSDGEDVS